MSRGGMTTVDRPTAWPDQNSKLETKAAEPTVFHSSPHHPAGNVVSPVLNIGQAVSLDS